MISGSNICDSTIVHFFAGLPGDQFDTPADIQLKLGDLDQTQYPGKVEGHPYIVDWDRDGQDDLVFVTKVYEQVTEPAGSASGSGNPTARTIRTRLFLNSDLPSRAAEFETAATTESEPFMPARPGITRWNWRVEPVEFDFPQQYDQAAIVNRSPSDLTRIEFYFSFGDLDGDGAFDIVYSATTYRQRLKEVNGQSNWNVAVIDSGLYLMRNRTKSGLPDFEPSTKIFQAPDRQRIHAHCLTNLDRDSQLDIVADLIHDGPQGDQTISELWSLTRQSSPTH